MRGTFAKHLFGFAGAIITLGCVAFFLKALFGAVSGLDATPLRRGGILTTAVLGCCYACTLFLLAKSWQILLRAKAPEHVPQSPLVETYALTQFAKYLPGNVFHLAGRHALLTREGFAQRALLVSTFHENFLMVLSALLVGSALFVAFPVPPVLNWMHDASVSPLFLSIFMRIAVACTLAGASAMTLQAGFRRFAGIEVRRALALNCLFFVLQGISFTVLLYAISGEIWLQTLAIVALSWMAGFVIPGAPGGAGVREIVMLLLLRGSVGIDEVVMTIALYRIVTFGGDLLFFGYGLARTRFHSWPVRLPRSSA